MANLYGILADAQHGEAMTALSREFGLTPQQTEAAVAALLPAISMGLKQSTATPEGLGNLFALMAQQPELDAIYDDPQVAVSREGRAAGNAALATMFGSREASRAIANQAQNLSGVTSSVLKKLLPVIAGIIISGLMRSGSRRAPQEAPEQGGGLIDILRQMFGQGQPAPGQSEPASKGDSSPWGIPPIGDILGPNRDAGEPSRPAPKGPMPSDQPERDPTDTGGDGAPGGDLLSQILRELEKGIREGRVKPVIVGPVEIDIPGKGGAGDSKQQVPGGDILGQILRDLLTKSGQTQTSGSGLQTGFGSALFGDRLETGRDVEQGQIDSLQEVFDQFRGSRRG
ncbi:MAG: DUF937 domain-containing protein [Methyloceanibacter sp.]